jgi:agmatine/peptidylarginine deiminase
MLMQWQEARDALPDSIRVLEMTHDDSWLRDTAPTVGTMQDHLL